jgi:hypothetical protein
MLSREAIMNKIFSAWLMAVPPRLLFLLPPSGFNALLVHTVPQVNLKVVRRLVGSC